MSRRWFGTDGIRGVANTELTPELALAAARAATRVLGSSEGARILVGRDTRESGPLLEAAVAAGVASAGGSAHLAGVIPTPGVSRLVAGGSFDGGIVISASHNPYQDNGIKMLGADGKKLSDEREARIEALMEDPGDPPVHVGSIVELSGSPSEYVDDLLGALDVDLRGLRILLDLAHGATYEAAPIAFGAAGAHVETICAEPDGRNINAGCGSTDLSRLAGMVEQGDFDLGLAFDGDGDRVLAVDHRGRIVDGDQILTVLAPWLKEKDRLATQTVVVTSMSNLGFHKAMEAAGIKVEVTDVGDRYVLERMEALGAVLGGEQSGHIIYLQAGVTGDGIQTGLLLAQAVRESGSPLAEIAGRMTHYPQVLLNVRVADKSRLAGSDEVWEAVEREQERLGSEGRVILRPSGTESLVRVMVEAPTREYCDDVARRLAGTVERALAGR
ncbi:MAG: phosphoglucosamine mutase [Thermoleophilia bacterium]